MTKRRRFTADFKAKVALEALRGDKTIQQIAAKHKVHPNQVSAWKRQAMDGLSAVFSNGAEKARMDHDGEIHDLHAKIGAQEPLPLDPHGEIEKAGEDRRHVLATAFDQLFHQSLDSAILVFPHTGSPCLFGRFHG